MTEKLTSSVNSLNNSSGWISLSLSVAVRARDEENTKALISQIANSQEDGFQEKIFKPVLQSFSEEDREWFDNFRKNTNWDD